MLLRFSVENHLSIRDSQELSLVASSSIKDDATGLINCAAAPGGKVLPAAVIYGANASGKSNVVAAIRFMRSAVLYSHNRGEPNGGVSREPFKPSPEYAAAPSKFTADFVIEGVKYYYGFTCSDEAFMAEWLYAFPSGRRQMLFERKDQRFGFGRSLKGRNKVISDLTRPNSLFVSAAAQNDHEAMLKIAAFFRSVHSDNTIEVPGEIASHLIGDRIEERVIKFLGRIGTGVISYRRQETNLSEQEKILRGKFFSLIQEITQDSTSDLPSDKRVHFQLAHKGRSGENIFLDLERESAGTRRLLILLSAVFQAIDAGIPLVVDELDASLHTQACEAILALFASPETNPHGAQLIATTHDTNLLRSDYLRRDQIWFTEKNEEGATCLYPLTDIRTRKGDNIAKGYLQGRYGAIPFAGSIDDLISMD